MGGLIPCGLLSCFSHVRFFANPKDCCPPGPLSIGFSRQKYWNRLSFPSPGYLPDPGVKPMSLTSPALAGRFFTSSATWKAHTRWRSHNSWRWDCSTNRCGCSPPSWGILSWGSSNAGSGSSCYNTSSLWSHDLLGWPPLAPWTRPVNPASLGNWNTSWNTSASCSTGPQRHQ